MMYQLLNKYQFNHMSESLLSASMQELPRGDKLSDKTSVASVIGSTRNVIGVYSDDIRDNQPWNEAKIVERKKTLDRKVLSGKRYSLLELYDYNNDVDRQQVLALLSNTRDFDFSKLSRQQRHEVIAAHLRITYRETLGRAVDTYMQLMEQYQNLRQMGAHGESIAEATTFNHLNSVATSAQSRLDLASAIWKSNKMPTKEQLDQAQKLDMELARLLMCVDDDVPGANRDGILPVHRLMLSMLNTHYEKVFEGYMDGGQKLMVNTKAKVDRVQAALEKQFPGKKEQEIPEEKAWPVIQSLDYTSMVEYRTDVDLLQRKLLVRNQELKRLGQQNVQCLADITRSLGVFQIQRARLASIRHHFDQVYDLPSKESPLSGTTSDVQMERFRQFLEAEQTTSIGALETHLDVVKKGVLKVGPEEAAEELWNETGRIFMSNLAHRMATLETCWIPDVPGFGSGVRDSAKEYLISNGLYDALGWPRDEKGHLKKELTSDEKAALKAKQESILTKIKTFNASGAHDRVSTSVQAAKALIKRKDLKAESFLDQGEIDPASLPQDVVTDKNIDILVGRFGVPAVYKMCFVQLESNWNAYSDEYRTLLTGFNDVVGVHGDMNRYFKDFAKGQGGVSALLLWLAAGGAIVVWEASRLIAKTGFRQLPTVARSVRQAGTTVVRGVRQAGTLLEKSLPGTSGAKVAEVASDAPVSSLRTMLSGATKSAEAERVLGQFGLTLVATEFLRVCLKNAHLKNLPDGEKIFAAYDLMKNPSIVAMNAPRYEKEMMYVERRMQCFIMEGNAMLLSQAIQRVTKKGILSEDQVEALRIQESCETVRAHSRDLGKLYYKLFPVTDAFVSDTRLQKRNVGINVSAVEVARERGIQAEKEEQKLPLEKLFANDSVPNPHLLSQPRIKMTYQQRSALMQGVLEDYNNRPRDPAKYEDLQEMYDQLMLDGAALLKKYSSK